MSLTATNNEKYSTAPSNWIFDTSVKNIGRECPKARNTGMFCTDLHKGGNIVDNESVLLGLDKQINKCGAELDSFNANEFTQPSEDVKKLYQNQHVTHEEDFLTSIETRVQRSCNHEGKTMYRPDFPLLDPQVPSNIILEERLRGGEWSRNLHRDNYTCETNDYRGGNK